MDGQRLYLAAAFVAGVLLTLGCKDLYPDLERRFRSRRRGGGRNAADEALRRGGGGGEGIALKDGVAGEGEDVLRPPQPSIPVGIEGTIGNTPLFLIKSLSEATGCEILGKAEFLNGAGGSPKDRVALSIIETAEQQGLLTPHAGDTIYEGTVGSTGISLAALARARGYRTHIVMPSDQSPEKAALLSALGASVERVSPAPIVDTKHFVNLARARAAEHTADPRRRGRGFFADQFETPANWRAHYLGTGPELLAQCGGGGPGGGLDAFVAGAGTGGTIAGVARYLKPRVPGCRVVLADPEGSGLCNKVRYGVMFDAAEREGTRRRPQVDTVVEGIGCNRLTANFEAGLPCIDDAVRVSDAEAVAMARWLVERDGVFVGSSSAVNCVAAVRTAWELGPGRRVVTVLCDGGGRHLGKFYREVAELAEGEMGEGVGLEEVLDRARDAAAGREPLRGAVASSGGAA